MISITNLLNILSNKVLIYIYIIYDFLYITSFDLCVVSIKISVKRHIFLSNATILVKIAHILSYILLFSFPFFWLPNDN